MRHTVWLDTGGVAYYDDQAILGEPGSQGTVFKGEFEQTPIAVKVYHDHHWARIENRTRYLNSREDLKEIRSICMPLALGKVSDTSSYSVIFPLHELISLEEYLERSPPLGNRLEKAIEITNANLQLHQAGIAHGDLSYDNITLDRETNEVLLIDLDNFFSIDLKDPPPALGTWEFLSPDLRDEFLNANRQVTPNFSSDNFALSNVLSELIIGHHPASSFDNAESFHNAMTSGRFPVPESDLAHLNSSLKSLFARSFSLNASTRPTPKEWLSTLIEVYQSELAILHDCGSAVFLEGGIDAQVCGRCQKAITLTKPVPNELILKLTDGSKLTISSDCFVGRSDLLGVNTVSARHLKLTTNSIDWFIAACGRNPTGVWTRDSIAWVYLVNDREYLLSPKLFPMRLWVGGVEVELHWNTKSNMRD